MNDFISMTTYGIKQKSKTLIKTVLYYRYFYLMLLPVAVWYIIFCYLPIYGVTLAFKTFNYGKGILGSPWIGIKNFADILNDFQFRKAFSNTLILSFGKLLFHFPVPIILSVLLNEMRFGRLKKTYQTVFTFPHFISWIVLSGIISNILGQNGAINQVLSLFGNEPISPMVQPSMFRPLIFITYIWKEMGWDSIIYLAAIAGISIELYESAEIDGANRFQRIIFITWPSIRPVVAILFILAIGHAMSGVSFDQVFNLYSPPVYDVADTIDTYVYRTSFTIGADFGYMTAVGLVKSIINLLLLCIANLAARKMGEEGLF